MATTRRPPGFSARHCKELLTMVVVISVVPTVVLASKGVVGDWVVVVLAVVALTNIGVMVAGRVRRVNAVGRSGIEGGPPR